MMRNNGCKEAIIDNFKVHLGIHVENMEKKTQWPVTL
jgi:hypothetical protein